MLFEGDGVAEAFELGDEALGLSFGVAAGAVVAAEVVVKLPVDNIYGDLATRAGSTCGTLIGTVLAPGATSAPCNFTGTSTGAAGASQTDVITVTGMNNGATVTATAQAPVTFTPARSASATRPAISPSRSSPVRSPRASPPPHGDRRPGAPSGQPVRTVRRTLAVFAPALIPRVTG